MPSTEAALVAAWLTDDGETPAPPIPGRCPGTLLAHDLEPVIIAITGEHVADVCARCLATL